jgi:hypothetical protein
MSSVEQAGEDRVRVEAIKATPVDRTVPRHERCAVSVADQRIIRNRLVGPFGAVWRTFGKVQRPAMVCRWVLPEDW